jgi:hypothetical protein
MIHDLAPVDEFPSRRRLATEELAALLVPSATDRVIDIGSELGGPSRYLASLPVLVTQIGVFRFASFALMKAGRRPSGEETPKAGTVASGVWRTCRWDDRRARLRHIRMCGPCVQRSL